MRTWRVAIVCAALTSLAALPGCGSDDDGSAMPVDAGGDSATDGAAGSGGSAGTGGVGGSAGVGGSGGSSGAGGSAGSSGSAGSGGAAGSAGSAGSAGAGGASGSSGSSGSAGSAGSGGGCATPSDCPGQDDDCQTRTCENGVCGVEFVAAGTAVSTQVAGDCKKDVCDGQGAVVTENDDADVLDDGNACTTDTCDNGSPAQTPLPIGTSCGANLVCDAAGNCVGCNVAADCPGSDDECQTRTCTAGTCGLAFTAAGTAVTNQTAGDCKEQVCDGQGAVVSENDDDDLPVDGQDCTDDVCTNGTSSNPPSAAGTSCSSSGGSLCNGTGACVGCLLASDCPGSDSECQARTCVAGVCGTSFTAAGTAVTNQTTGDCQLNVCDGSGDVTTEDDDTDVPANTSQCTTGACFGGSPMQTNVPQGSACSENGGTQCDGNGSCVQCVSASDCPGMDDECQTRTCTAGVCGMAFAPQGTPLASQTAGNCQTNVCDGNGGTTVEIDDGDLPVDGNQCTSDLCTNGVASNPPLSAGNACSQNGGALCDGLGACVQCLAATDCPGIDGECQIRSCSAGVCGMDFAPLGQVVSTQSSGDCQENVCDGSGGTTTQNLDTDVPVDGNDCTGDVCTSGVPSNPPSASGTACAGGFCDGASQCLECVENANCASNQCIDNACAPNLFFSEYVEGSSENKAVEILNNGSTSVDLSACGVRIYSNGSSTPGSLIALSGTLAAGDVYVLCHTNASFTSQCDQFHGNVNFNGDDAVELLCNGTPLDVIGQIGVDPGTTWGTNPTTTVNATLLRSCSVGHGDPIGTDAFDPALEWNGLPIDTFTGLGDASCTP